MGKTEKKDELTDKQKKAAAKKDPDFNMVIFGNFGQVQYYHEFDEMSQKQEKRWHWTSKEIRKETIRIDETKNICYVKKELNKEKNLNEKDGMDNFKSLLLHATTQLKIDDADNIIFMGEAIRPDTSTKLEMSEKLYSKFLDRIKCSWALLLDLITKSKLLVKKGKDWEMKEELDVLLGKNLYDIDPKINLDTLSKYVPKTKNSDVSNADFKKHIKYGIEENFNKLHNADSVVFTSAPRIITLKSKSLTVQVVDFNSNMILCLDNITEDKYNECIEKKGLHEVKMKPFINWNTARKYAYRLYYALENSLFLPNKNDKVWRVLRAVHPPINPKYGDKAEYFKEIRSLDEKDNTVKITLMTIFKQKALNIFIGADARQASLSVLPYSNKFVEAEPTYKQKEGKYGCYYTEQDKLFKEFPKYVTPEKCKDDMKFTLPLSFKDISPSKTMLYVFNIGNAGSRLCGLHEGKTSNGYTIWQRSIKGDYGFATLYLKGDIFDFKFLEKKKGKIITSATFEFRDTDNQPDQNTLGALIQSQFCK